MSGYLYRAFDADGDLLYIGATFDAGQRLAAHADRSEWFADVERITLEHFDTREDAFAAELVAIRDEEPRFNLARPGSRRPSSRRVGHGPEIDLDGAMALRELREARGLTPEALAADIARMAYERGSVDASTIRRIEKFGHVPRPRVAFVLAAYFEMVPHELWPPHARMLVAA